MTHHFLYWLGTSWWCLGLACALLLCMSKICLLLMRLLQPGGFFAHFAAYPWLLMAWATFWFLILYGPLPLRLGFAWLWAFLLSAHSFALFYSFAFPAALFCHSCYVVIWPKPARLLWACCLFFSQWLSMVIGLSIYITCGFLCPICFFLGILGPFAFLGPFPNFCIPMSFYLTSLGFPGPISLSLVLGAHGLAINSLLSLFVLFLACCGLFSLFYITYYP